MLVTRATVRRDGPHGQPDSEDSPSGDAFLTDDVEGGLGSFRRLAAHHRKELSTRSVEDG